MYSKVDKPKINNSRMNAKQGKGVIRNYRTANTFLDNRPSSISLSNLTNVMQQRGGSHNKKQMIKIKSYIIRDNTSSAVITHKVNEDIDLAFSLAERTDIPHTISLPLSVSFSTGGTR